MKLKKTATEAFSLWREAYGEKNSLYTARMFELPKRLSEGLMRLTTKDHRPRTKTGVCVCVCVCVEKESAFRNQRDTWYCNVDAETLRRIIKTDFVIRDWVRRYKLCLQFKAEEQIQTLESRIVATRQILPYATSPAPRSKRWFRETRVQSVEDFHKKRGES